MTRGGGVCAFPPMSSAARPPSTPSTKTCRWGPGDGAPIAVLIEASLSGGGGVTAGFYLADGGLAEKAAVFAVELAGAFVADFEGCAGGVEAVVDHALAGYVKAQLLLILQRAHGGERAEVMVEGGDAHLRHDGQVFDTERLVVVGAEPGDDAGGAVALLAECGDGAEVHALRAAEQAINNFVLDEMAEERDVLRCVEEIDEARAGAEELRRGDADGHAARVGRFSGQGEFFFAEDFADGGHVELEEHAEDWFLLSGFGDLTDDGKIDCGEEESCSVAGVGRGAKIDALFSLYKDGEPRHVGSGCARRGPGTAVEAEAVNGGVEFSLSGGVGYDFAG